MADLKSWSNNSIISIILVLIYVDYLFLFKLRFFSWFVLWQVGFDDYLGIWEYYKTLDLTWTHYIWLCQTLLWQRRWVLPCCCREGEGNKSWLHTRSPLTLMGVRGRGSWFSIGLHWCYPWLRVSFVPMVTWPPLTPLWDGCDFITLGQWWKSWFCTRPSLTSPCGEKGEFPMPSDWSKSPHNPCDRH